MAIGSRVTLERLLPSMFLLALLSGCPAVSTMTTARPIGAGMNDVTVSPTAYGFSVSMLGQDPESGSTSSKESGYLVGGALDVMYRRGIGSHFDLGFTLSGLGLLGLDAKINFIDAPIFALSVDPSFGGVFIGAGDVGAGYIEFSIPLLADLALGESVRLTFAPKYVGIYGFGGSSSSSVSAYNSLAGGSAGVELKLGKTFRLMPHGGAIAWVNKPSALSVNSVFFSGGCAFKFIF